MLACGNGHLHTGRFLLFYGAEVNAKDIVRNKMMIKMTIVTVLTIMIMIMMILPMMRT